MYRIKNFPKNQGHFAKKLVLPDTIKTLLLAQNWEELDMELAKLIDSNGILYKELQHFFPNLTNIEFIISIRDSNNEYEEDGIWHDDGSRIFAFSLGLNVNPKLIQGGDLLIRKKNSEDIDQLPPPAFGTCYFFKTGEFDYEHKVCRVTSGKRIVMAGWCT
jgi:Rps23 Pro-64 3,4-dihydroxylase Tpa1-like proline 4-hydroxylase